MAEPPWLEEALEKYRRKLGHVALRGRLEKVIPEMMTRAAVTEEKDTKTVTRVNVPVGQAQIHRTIIRVKEILDQSGVFPDWHPSYYAYALALDKAQRQFKYILEGGVEYCYDLKREYEILRDRWAGRGLETSILDKIYDAIVYRCK